MKVCKTPSARIDPWSIAIISPLFQSFNLEDLRAFMPTHYSQGQICGAEQQIEINYLNSARKAG